MKILLCNDDGYQAQGIVALYEALRHVADVEVIAPEFNNSAKSNALTLHSPLYVQRAANGFRYIDGTPAEMGPTEYRLLQFFMTHQERAYTRGQLLDQVWGGNVYVEERTVDVHIRRLRKALGEAYENLVQTVRGTGYRFSTKA